MRLISPSFDHKGIIPSRYTCEEDNTHPPLEFLDVPENTASLVLLMNDPDVPKETRKEQMFDHWVLFNIPPKTTKIVENTAPEGIQGKNTHGTNTYRGPCPPYGEHRYFF